VRLIVLDSKRVKMKFSHSVNPDSEVLEEAVDLKDIDMKETVVRKSSKSKDIDRLPKKKTKMGRLSRSGMLKEEQDTSVSRDDGRDDRKSLKRKQVESEEDPTDSVDKPKKKEKKKDKKRKIEKDELPSDGGSIDGGSAKQFSHDSGVVGVEVMTTIDDKKVPTVAKEKKSVGVDLSVLKGNDSMQVFGTGGSSAWD
jgi:hypothetical protein